MVFEHEIPEGTKLYFGRSARIKRELENAACEIFYSYGFEEVITPYFSYLEHQQNFSNRHLIRLSSQNNHQISLRYDSTIDTIRTITKRLERATSHKKWFYIQPVFSYPTNEIYQIGAESIYDDNLHTMISVGLEILSSCDIKATLQFSNVKILALVLAEIGIDKDTYKALSMRELAQKARFVEELLRLNTLQDLDSFLPNAPMFLRFELERLSHKAHACKYAQILISPLEPPLVDYYDDVVFRVFSENDTLMLGGKYNIQECLCCGFGIYTDSVISHILARESSKSYK
ncbi:ATP phosphoribosyltransferase regulatory subunit [Helicobacter canis]|uniref:ATP phosphoribosyltransferase regulatory subunit n=1 Tax=Helicobacter canis TaxID=29419 RepID=UPI0026EA9939|nr:ATP phosphoribosyltransferase regulatory subunit [Helicobacter canis]